MGREVIGDHVDLFAARLIGDDIREERDELGRGVPSGRLSQDFTGLGIERSVQRQRAVPEVLEAVPLGAARRERQHRILAVQRLDGRLLIDAEHRGMLGGWKYRPMISAALVSKSGSFEAT